MQSASHFWELILGTVIGLLPIINPLVSVPVFLAITEGDSEERRQVQAMRGCLYMVGILVSFLVGGSFIMSFFGLSIPGLRIAGGILVCGIALTMFAPPKEDDDERKRREEALAKRDISFSPLAMPMLSGPGSIAVTIGFTSLARHWLDYVAIILGILIVACISFFTLTLSGGLLRVIGVNGMSALTKIMGFLLLCLGIQFVVTGAVGVLTAPEVIDAFRQALKVT